MEIISDDKIYVRCLGGNGSTFDVATKLFELVPHDEILQKGMYVIEARNKIMGYLETIPFEDILYQSSFKV